ncbi:MAG: hypothetical protein M0D54_19780 [Hyphomonadaceae bacterium JAD_PAG50586_4]|nr:MAG: hypothetical protein M0D54_19780 [Hyphomonadaceae bacterium JAD_PAG50586_4]
MAEQTGKLEPEIGEQVFGGGRYGSGLLDALRSAGLAIGQREHVAVGALIADLIATSEGTIALADLGSHLAPLLARSPQERETFFRVFDALAPTWRTGDLEGERQVPKPQRATLQRRRVNVRAIILGVIAAVGLGAFAIIAPQYFQTAEPPTTQPSVSDVLEANGPRETPTSQPQSEDMARLNRVQDAAAEFFNAPTLEELGRELAATSPIGWSTDAYAQRLHELTGMPRRVPIEVEPDVTFDPILMAVDLIERPGLETDPRVRYSVHEIGFSARAESLREAEQAAFLDAEEARVSEETRGVLRLNGVTASDLQGPRPKWRQPICRSTQLSRDESKRSRDA